MKLSLANKAFNSFVYYLINAWLILIILASFILILTYPYKRLVSGNVVVDIEVSLQKQNFTNLTKATNSSYYCLSQPKGTLSIAPNNIWCYLIDNMRMLLFCIAGFLIFLNLRQLVLNIRSGNSFTKDNCRIIRRWALIIIVFPFLMSLRTYLLNAYIPDSLIINGYKVIKPEVFTLRSLFSGIFMGLLLIVISNIFRDGEIIKEEADLTI